MIEDIDNDSDHEVEEDADETAEWLTDALHRAFQPHACLDYFFYMGEEWLLLRRVDFREYPEVIAEYPIDHDIYQMFQSAVAAVKRVVAGGGDRKGFNDDHSVYRHGL